MERTILNFRLPLTDAEKKLIESLSECKEITLLGRKYIPEATDINYVTDVIHLDRASEGHRHVTVTLCPVL